jgi:hypothetical protein
MMQRHLVHHDRGIEGVDIDHDSALDRFSVDRGEPTDLHPVLYVECETIIEHPITEETVEPEIPRERRERMVEHFGEE